MINGNGARTGISSAQPDLVLSSFRDSLISRAASIGSQECLPFLRENLLRENLALPVLIDDSQSLEIEWRNPWIGTRSGRRHRVPA